jgi:hypothetical protein
MFGGTAAFDRKADSQRSTELMDVMDVMDGVCGKWL